MELAQPPLLKYNLGPGTDTDGEGFGRRHLLLWDWVVSRFLAQKLGFLAYNPLREGCGPEEMALAVPFPTLNFKLPPHTFVTYFWPSTCSNSMTQ